MEPMQQAYKIDPKLRVIANGDLVVNTMRAERCTGLVVRDQRVLDIVPEMTGANALSYSVDAIDGVSAPVERPPMDAPPAGVFINVYIQVSDTSGKIPPSLLKYADSGSISQRHDLITATIPLDALPEIAADPYVISIERSESITFSPPLEVSLPQAAFPDGFQRAPGLAGGSGGAGVLVGIIDVQGFDFAHPDFLDPAGHTRFVRIWDQGGDSHPAPSGFDYGAEITQEMMNAALDASVNLGMTATHLEPQSQMSPGSHGTHVSSIAAGNHGVAPAAVIAAVLISLPEVDQDRRKSFYDSSRITHAVNYLTGLAVTLGLPLSINVSLGTNGHAHDGSSVSSRWIDYALTSPGCCVTVAAGNAGQEKAAQAGDWGWVSGRIHTSGTVPQGGTLDIEWVVIGDGIADLSENEIEIWYPPQDHFGIQIKPPDGQWTEILYPGEFIENRNLPSKTFLSIYNQLYSPSNGVNYISVYLSPYFNRAGVVGISAGTWLIRLHGLDVRDGTFHAWIERDDARQLGKLGNLQGWNFPSFMSEISNVDKCSVSSLACGNNVISVANLDEATSKIHITSSQGPTRDGRMKPDIAAPGTNILAACGFNPANPWIRMTGTSMASPYVTGMVAQMLSVDASLTASQIRSMLCRSARPLQPQFFHWLDDAGFGILDPAGALAEIKTYQQRKDRTHP